MGRGRQTKVAESRDAIFSKWPRKLSRLYIRGSVPLNPQRRRISLIYVLYRSHGYGLQGIGHMGMDCRGSIVYKITVPRDAANNQSDFF